MRQVITKVYQYEELSKESKEIAREWYRNAMYEDFYPYNEYITEHFQRELELLGYPIDDIEWRLSYSQGDGMAFYGRINSDNMKLIVERNKNSFDDKQMELFEEILENNLYVGADITRNSFGHHYSHYNTMMVEVESDCVDTMIEYIYDIEYDEDNDDCIEKYNFIETFLDELETVVTDEIREISQRLEREGYKEIEYYTSDEVIEETIVANEYEFTANGSRW